MQEKHDIRWEQRFQNFDKAFLLLSGAFKAGSANLSDLEKEGVIQRFEYSFELAWKTLKDYLETGGVIISPVTPRDVIKAGFAAKIIEDGQAWIDMLNHRNLLSHTYDFDVFDKAVREIENRYLPAIARLHAFFRNAES